MKSAEFFDLETAELTPEQFCFIQDNILKLNNEELGAALGYASREKGRKVVSKLRSSKSNVSPSIVTSLWFLAYSDTLPAWAEHLTKGDKS